MHAVFRVFRGIPGGLRTLIKHVGVLIIFLMPRKQLTVFEKGKIVAWSEGVSNNEIGMRLKRTHHTIVRFLKHFKATGSHKQRTGGQEAQNDRTARPFHRTAGSETAADHIG